MTEEEELTSAIEYMKRKIEESSAHYHYVVDAVRYFQLKRGLQVDGKLGHSSTRELNRLCSYARFYPLPIFEGHKPQISSGHAEDNSHRTTHRGADYMYRISGQWVVPSEVPCLAVAAGKVIEVEERHNGWCVTLEHPDGYRSKYRHLAQPDVTVGDWLYAGNPIATFDQSQNPPHCHLEIYAPGNYPPRITSAQAYRRTINPRKWLQHAQFAAYSGA